jgi:hypothetical protein
MKDGIHGKEKTNREKLKEFGEACSYAKPCEECDMRSKCSQDITKNY